MDLCTGTGYPGMHIHAYPVPEYPGTGIPNLGPLRCKPICAYQKAMLGTYIRVHVRRYRVPVHGYGTGMIVSILFLLLLLMPLSITIGTLVCTP